MEKKIKKNSKIFYPKTLRRRAFFELSKGGSLLKFLQNEGFNIAPLIKRDKKYLSKLAYKWKKEFFEDLGKINIVSYELTDDVLLNEIEIMENSLTDCF